MGDYPLSVFSKRSFATVENISKEIIQRGEDLKRPHVVLIGSQGVGKSSIVENIVGREFLPRGSNIATRRPLILKLIPANEEFGKFSHCGDKKFVNFTDIENEIQAETIKTAGEGGRISADPINLSIYSPRVPNLTLIDLPGIIRAPLKNQPHDTERVTNDLVTKFVEKDSIILAVSSANTGLSNSDALKISRKLDPEGKRTIGVITKLDLVDEGTDARETLENDVFPLRKGYVAVKCRNFINKENHTSIQDTLADEKKFFSSHEAYCHLANQAGTSFLCKTLHSMIYYHIRNRLISLKNELPKKLSILERDLNELKDVVGDSTEKIEKGSTKILEEFKTNFLEKLEASSLTQLYTEYSREGCLIYKSLYENFQLETNEKKLETEILDVLNSEDQVSCLFTKVFENVTKKQLSSSIQPAFNCIESVLSEMQSIAQFTCSKLMAQYPRLKKETLNCITNCIDERKEYCEETVRKMIETQMIISNVCNQDSSELANAPESTNFRQLREKFLELISKHLQVGRVNEGGVGESSQSMESRLREKVEFLATSLKSYLIAVKKILKDQIIKTIISVIIKNVREYVEGKLIEDVQVSADEMWIMAKLVKRPAQHGSNLGTKKFKEQSTQTDKLETKSMQTEQQIVEPALRQV